MKRCFTLYTAMLLPSLFLNGINHKYTNAQHKQLGLSKAIQSNKKKARVKPSSEGLTGKKTTHTINKKAILNKNLHKKKLVRVVNRTNRF